MPGGIYIALSPNLISAIERARKEFVPNDFLKSEELRIPLVLFGDHINSSKSKQIEDIIECVLKFFPPLPFSIAQKGEGCHLNGSNYYSIFVNSKEITTFHSVLITNLLSLGLSGSTERGPIKFVLSKSSNVLPSELREPTTVNHNFVEAVKYLNRCQSIMPFDPFDSIIFDNGMQQKGFKLHADPKVRLQSFPSSVLTQGECKIRKDVASPVAFGNRQNFIPSYNTNIAQNENLTLMRKKKFSKDTYKTIIDLIVQAHDDIPSHINLTSQQIKLYLQHPDFEARFVLEEGVSSPMKFAQEIGMVNLAKLLNNTEFLFQKHTDQNKPKTQLIKGKTKQKPSPKQVTVDMGEFFITYLPEDFPNAGKPSEDTITLDQIEVTPVQDSSYPLDIIVSIKPKQH